MASIFLWAVVKEERVRKHQKEPPPIPIMTFPSRARRSLVKSIFTSESGRERGAGRGRERMVEPPNPKPPVQQKPVVTSTLLFRMANPELYIGYNRWIAGVGSLVCGVAIAKVCHMKYEFEMEKARNPRWEYEDDDD